MEIKIERVCENCDKVFLVIPSRVKHGRGKNCSAKCQYNSIKSKPKDTVERICIGCGCSFPIFKSRLNGRAGAGKYCTRKCRDKYRKGKNVPNFIDGKNSNWHGANWYSQRRKAKKRDGCTCVDCGATESLSVDLYGQTLHVHHIVPFRKFGSDYVKANDLSNLETLCASCHREKESKIQKSERLL